MSCLIGVPGLRGASCRSALMAGVATGLLSSMLYLCRSSWKYAGWDTRKQLSSSVGQYFISKSPNIIFSESVEDYSSVSYQKGICMSLIKFGKCMEKFLNLLELNQSIRIYAQFVNNSLRRPSYIFCTQDPDTFKLFLVLCACSQ